MARTHFRSDMGSRQPRQQTYRLRAPNRPPSAPSISYGPASSVCWKQANFFCNQKLRPKFRPTYYVLSFATGDNARFSVPRGRILRNPIFSITATALLLSHWSDPQVVCINIAFCEAHALPAHVHSTFGVDTSLWFESKFQFVLSWSLDPKSCVLCSNMNNSHSGSERWVMKWHLRLTAGSRI